MKSPFVGGIADLLEVGEAEQVDVVLPEPPVGNRGPDRAEVEFLLGQVELQEEGVAALEVRAGDQVESFPSPPAAQQGKRSQIGGYLLEGRRGPERREPLDETLSLAKVLSRCSAYGFHRRRHISQRGGNGIRHELLLSRDDTPARAPDDHSSGGGLGLVESGQ